MSIKRKYDVLHWMGQCPHTCPHLKVLGQPIDVNGVCLQHRAALDYYDGWLAVCGGMITPQGMRANKQRFRRWNKKGIIPKEGKTPLASPAISSPPAPLAP